MRHLKAGRRLGRTASHRKATLRNMVTSLLEHERIETTEAKAKELKRLADKMITLGKRGDLHARRQAMQIIRSETVGKKLFDDVAPRFKDRSGGYTRILKIRRRLGDNAPVSIIELVVQGKQKAAQEKKKEKEKKPAKEKTKKEKQPVMRREKKIK
ncbi:MAG: 50S ribosomal protein L17 [Proteobacteria bacterium]|nr:50S ribosomal protein L17 [Pseudomonadota bacterium]